jgi:hypothetical protein
MFFALALFAMGIHPPYFTDAKICVVRDKRLAQLNRSIPMHRLPVVQMPVADKISRYV